ncbi:MAG: Glycogen synthase [Chlamydiae bacterium]|nr:Glycogen synthase [Chlamydiota bacterium]
MHITHISSELAPIAKVGGLGDVIHGLARAQLKNGDKVEVFLPKYDSLNLDLIESLEIVSPSLPSHFDEKTSLNTIWRGKVDSIPVYLFESHHKEEFFERKEIYGYPDDIARFTYFCMAVLAFLENRAEMPDLLHLHDWHTSLLALLSKTSRSLSKTGCVLTIHNLAYQGECQKQDLLRVGITDAKLQEGEGYNLLKGGILYADAVTTVSPTYAREILETGQGGALQKTLRKIGGKFSGILNGIEVDYWDPAQDPLLPAHFHFPDLSGKKTIQQELRKRLSLADLDAPLVCAITRLVPQKGPELLKAALLKTLEHGGQFVLLGSALDEKTHEEFFNLKRMLTGCPNVHLELTFNEAFSHLVFGAADLFLVPSLFEPCGLTQLIAMRYGAVPLVRKTGGLADTVFEGKNGFVFEKPTAEGIHEALGRALVIWREKPEVWQKLVKAGMESNTSWQQPASAYHALYQKTKSAIDHKTQVANSKST